MGEVIGFVFEFLFLAMGIYLYLFSIGKVKNKNPENEKKAKAWRESNGWLRYAALALTAITIVNIIVHIKDIL